MNCMAGILGLVLLAGAAFSQEAESPVAQVDWLEGPAVGRMSTIAEIKVPEGYVFTGPNGARTVMESMGNLVNGSEIGFISSTSNSWFAIFEFDDIGYVKDDEKDSLDADAIMKSLLEGQKQSNLQRREAQMTELEIDGWFKEPFYNDLTQNLEWCTQLHEKGTDQPFANHNIRILGRYGVTRITLVANIDQLGTAIPELSKILDDYKYTSGGQYAEYRKGDKIAKYGLTALVAGGAAAVALKSGLFKHLWKLLVVGGAAISGFFKKFKRKS